MKSVKIIYEINENGDACVEMTGSGHELFKGVCRLAAHVKRNIKVDGDSDFYELLVDGAKNGERELRLQDIVDKKGSGENVISELLDLLKDSLNA